MGVVEAADELIELCLLLQVRRALKLGKRDKIRYVVQPDGVRAIGQKLRSRIRSLVGRVNVDLDAPLDPEDE